MVFHLVAVGRVSSPDLQSACETYTKRILHYARFIAQELPGSRSIRDDKVVLRTEGSQILDAIDQIPNRVLITRTGKAFSSREFSVKLQEWMERAQDTAFVIGGAFGTHPDVHSACSQQISLSHMTLPHELARLVLLEQVYRGFSLLRGEPYHKGS